MVYFELVNKELKIIQKGEFTPNALNGLRLFILRSESKINFIRLINCGNEIINEIRLWGINWGVEWKDNVNI